MDIGNQLKNFSYSSFTNLTLNFSTIIGLEKNPPAPNQQNKKKKKKKNKKKNKENQEVNLNILALKQNRKYFSKFEQYFQ